MLVKKKISLAFVILGFVLLLSCIIAIYEFVTMRRTVAQVVADDVISINTNTLLLQVTDEYNYSLLSTMGDSTYTDVSTLPDIKEDDRFLDNIRNIRGKFTTPQERIMADSVRLAYVAYAHILEEAKGLWNSEYTVKRRWYFDRLYPVYMQLRHYIMKLNISSQEALKENSDSLSEGFYRSIIPCALAIIVGIILLFLFNYYLNFYYFNPLTKINKSLRNYKLSKKITEVKIDSADEMEELNENIKDLMRENRQLSQKL
ncbi:MAG: hypothetical protein IKI67_05115 [Bacteroidales bacterium]|nr:hypothetical protein [Bacteroidales bacterium]